MDYRTIEGGSLAGERGGWAASPPSKERRYFEGSGRKSGPTWEIIKKKGGRKPLFLFSRRILRVGPGRMSGIQVWNTDLKETRSVLFEGFL